MTYHKIIQTEDVLACWCFDCFMCETLTVRIQNNITISLLQLWAVNFNVEKRTQIKSIRNELRRNLLHTKRSQETRQFTTLCQLQTPWCTQVTTVLKWQLRVGGYSEADTGLLFRLEDKTYTENDGWMFITTGSYFAQPDLKIQPWLRVYCLRSRLSSGAPGICGYNTFTYTATGYFLTQSISFIFLSSSFIIYKGGPWIQK
jgi:hypothetical protein